MNIQFAPLVGITFLFVASYQRDENRIKAYTE